MDDAAPEPGIAPIRVLLVEDDPAAARLTRRRLAGSEHARFDIRHVETLDGALSLLERHDFDVMLLDIQLPDARDMATVTHACAVARLLPVVVLSSQDDEELMRRALRAGAQDYLVKSEQSTTSLAMAIPRAVARFWLRRAGAADPSPRIRRTPQTR